MKRVPFILRWSRVLARARIYKRDTRGAAAVEFAIWLSALTLPILNVVDTGFYIYQRMQLENAAQTAAQKAWALCDASSKLPASKNCPTLVSTVQSAAQKTSLDTGATVQLASSFENYYCVDTTGILQPVGNQVRIDSGNAPTLPGSFASTSSPCSSAGTNYTGNSSAPGDYILITVNFDYAPLFRGLTITSAFATPITKTAWMRLN